MKKEVFDIESRINHLINMLVDFTPKLVAAILLLLVGLWFINRLSRIATKSMERRELEVSLRTFLKSLISIGLKVILIVTVAGIVGIGTSSFVTILGAAGLAVGLALQGSLSNFAGGVLILIFKPYKVGDTIEALGQAGTVKEIQIFNTILLTDDLKTIILPNGAVSNGTIINNSRHGILRGETQITVSAEHDFDTIKQLFLTEISTINEVKRNPAPEISILKIADGGVTISVKVYSESSQLSTVVACVIEKLKIVMETNQIKSPPKKVLTL